MMSVNADFSHLFVNDFFIVNVASITPATLIAKPCAKECGMVQVFVVITTCYVAYEY